jgi:hypothetical protein
LVPSIVVAANADTPGAGDDAVMPLTTEEAAVEPGKETREDEAVVTVVGEGLSVCVRPPGHVCEIL